MPASSVIIMTLEVSSSGYMDQINDIAEEGFMSIQCLSLVNKDFVIMLSYGLFVIYT